MAYFRSFLRSCAKPVTWLWSNFEGKRNIPAQLIVNLTTALIIFLCVALLKDPFYKLILPSIEDYPIYCIEESYTTEIDKQHRKLGLGKYQLHTELYIINLTDKHQTEERLEDFLKQHSRTHKDTTIRIRTKTTSARQKNPIAKITTDSSFNASKSSFREGTPKKENDVWEIVIGDIRERGIIRCLIEYEKPVYLLTVRGGDEYIEIDYPGRK